MNIVTVRYYSETTGEFSARDYSYYSEDSLKVGDIVIVPVRDTVGKAQVSSIDVPESEIAAFRDKVKVIPPGSVVPVGVPNRSVPNETEVVIRVDPGAYLAPTEARGYWWCEVCKAEINPQEVTMHETCENRLVWIKELESALIRINPGTDNTALALLAESYKLRDYALARIIATDADFSAAVNDLAVISRVKKALTEKKAEYYKPIKAHLDSITASFQVLLTPIETADKITRDKWQAYKNEQSRRKAEAEKINQEKLDLARREEALTGEHTVDLTPVVAPEPILKMRTDMGTAQTTKTWRGEVVDFKLLPEEYKMPDYVKLGRVIRAGLHTIPGVRIFEEEGIRVSPNRY